MYQRPLGTIKEQETHESLSQRGSARRTGQTTQYQTQQENAQHNIMVNNTRQLNSENSESPTRSKWFTGGKYGASLRHRSSANNSSQSRGNSVTEFTGPMRPSYGNDFE